MSAIHSLGDPHGTCEYEALAGQKWSAKEVASHNFPGPGDLATFGCAVNKASGLERWEHFVELEGKSRERRGVS